MDFVLGVQTCLLFAPRLRKNGIVPGIINLLSKPPKTPPALPARAWQAVRINRILGEPFRQPPATWYAGAPMDEINAELELLTWLLWVDMALLLACLAIVILREFG
jgi:hypothetical protein